MNLPIESVYYEDQCVDVLRLDKTDDCVSGNKFFKLKYNVVKVVQEKYSGILTFGGAYSNHILATAAACFSAKKKSIGIIRGEELATKPLNATLTRAVEKFGMQLVFVSREEYKNRYDQKYVSDLLEKYPNFLHIPEGGTNALAVKGCAEIWGYIPNDYEKVILAVGTGGTIAGLLSNKPKLVKKIIGYDVVGDSESTILRIEKYIDNTEFLELKKPVFKGYAKNNTALNEFCQQINQNSALKVEPIYSGKALHALFCDTEIRKEKCKTLFIHTGGLQVIQEMTKKGIL